MFTHINIAFAKVSSTYTATASTSETGAGGLYEQVVGKKAQYPHLKVIISFGGWGSDKTILFSALASSSSSRATFIKSAIAWCRKYGFDGVDIDWEYPAYASQGGKAADKPNYTLLLKEMRAAMDADAAATGKSRLSLTIATPTGGSPLQGYEMSTIHQYLDWINLMAYDIHGGWESTTNYHTPVYSSDSNSIDWAVNYYLNAGVPSSKIVMGLATYGKTWTLSSSSNTYLGASAVGSGTAGSCSGEAGVLAYYEIKDFIASGASVVYDSKALAAYAFKGNQWVGYDNPTSMKAKADYIKSKNLGGGMFWAMDLDGPKGKFNELQCVAAQNLFNLAGSTPPPPPPPPPTNPIVSIQPPAPKLPPPPPPPAIVNPQPPATASSTCSGITSKSATNTGSRKVISYLTVHGPQRSGDCKFDTNSIDGNIFTHINIAFAKVSSTYTATASTFETGAGGLYEQVVGKKAKFPHLKVIISFGGWGSAKTILFSELASSSSSRATFIKSAIAWCRKYGFDGVDIDWEYPAYASQGGKAADKPNYTLLLKEMRAAMDADAAATGKSRLSLTIATPTGGSPLQGYEMSTIHQYLDWINLMAYDIHGGWESTTNYHTPVYSSDSNSIDWAVNYYLNAGVPSSKIVMGLATYGKTWTLSSSSKTFLGAPAVGSGTAGSCSGEAGVLAYYEIKDFIASGASVVYDSKALAAYAFKGNQWVGYDNPTSMKAKADYIKSKNLGGGMFWAMDLDGPKGKFNELQCVAAQNLFNLAGSTPPPPPPPPTNPIVVAQPPPVVQAVVQPPPTLLQPAQPVQPVQPTNLGYYVRPASEHLPLALSFRADNWENELRNLIASPSYNDQSVYKPSSDPLGGNKCNFLGGPNYDKSVSQMFIGRPSTETVEISNTPGLTVRLPDKSVGLMLAYSLDMYGLNPAMFLGLSSKESFFPALFKSTDDGTYFIVDDTRAQYDCYASNRDGLCRDSLLDGPFQVETPAMSTDVSIFAQRFYPGSETVKSARTPLLQSDSTILGSSTFRAFHDSYTLDNSRALILSALDFHYRFNLLIRLKDIGFLAQYNARTTRAEKQQLLFASALYTYNRGIYDKTTLNGKLSTCSPGKDPILDCGLNGYGGHSQDAGKICTLVERSTEVYDYNVYKEDVDRFIDKLESTYPYDAVAGHFNKIDWTAIRQKAASAFTILDTSRGSKGAISFRYDWRALVAVIRAFLPAKEALIGPTMKNIDNFYGNSIAADLAPLTSRASQPFAFVNTAGAKAIHSLGALLVDGEAEQQNNFDSEAATSQDAVEQDRTPYWVWIVVGVVGVATLTALVAGITMYQRAQRRARLERF
jgi:chitinase